MKKSIDHFVIFSLKTLYLLSVLTCYLLIAGCDTVKVAYTSPKQGANYYKIKVVTLTHCGCTHIYADHYNNSILDFQIFYFDSLATKSSISFDEYTRQKVSTSLFATADIESSLPFDSLDREIFNKIDSIIATKSKIVYPLTRRNYVGYLRDTLTITPIK